MKSMHKLTSAVIGCALLAPAFAQDDQMIEEVIVTAQRRAESVQEVPIAVSAYSDEQLRTLQVTEGLDMTRLVPNLMGSNNTGLGSANVYSLRALNNTESIPTFDPPVGSYIDDVFISRQNANNYALFDIDRIEVLRGPQGTLFGRNTTGGAVNVILKKPAEEFGGYVELGFGRFSQVRFRGSVDLPVQDNLLVKLSAYATDDDGFVENRTTGEDGINYEKNVGLRAAVRWLGEVVTWDAAFHTWNRNTPTCSTSMTRTRMTAIRSPVCGPIRPRPGRIPCTDPRRPSLSATGSIHFPSIPTSRRKPGGEP